MAALQVTELVAVVRHDRVAQRLDVRSGAGLVLDRGAGGDTGDVRGLGGRRYPRPLGVEPLGDERVRVVADFGEISDRRCLLVVVAPGQAEDRIADLLRLV